MRRAAIAVALAIAGLASAARADEDPPREDSDPAALFRGATEALAGERPGEAIAKLEALGDRGVTDAVISFDRGLAYAARVRAGAEQPGDLGRAAHGFEEARQLTRDPGLAAEAASALEAVRSEVARRRARGGDPVEIAGGVSLGRSIVNVLPEDAWAALAGVAAVVLSIALLVRARASLPRVRVAATTSGAISGALLVTTALLTWAARDARLHLREGVVVTPSARLLDARHLALDGVPALPEGVRVRIVDETGGFSRVALGDKTGYLPSSAVLPLAKR
jgi:hypothetical protein